MRIRLTDFVVFVAVTCLLSLGWLTDIYAYMLPNYFIYVIAIISFIAIFCMIYKTTVKIHNWYFVLLCQLIFIFYGILSLTEGNSLIDCFIYALTYAFVMFSYQWNEKWIDYVLFWVKIFSLLYVFTTILFKLMPGLYLNSIVPIFDDYSAFLTACYNQGYVGGLTAHYSRNGTYTAFATIIFFVILLKEIKQNKMKWYTLLFLLCSVYALILTGKRAHSVFALLTLAYVIYLFMADKPRKRIVNMLFVIILGITIIIVAINTIPAFGNLFIRFIGLGEDKNVNTRFMLWSMALEYFKSEPILGYGWRHFMQDTAYILGNSLNVHNMYIQLLCETGIIGFVVFVSWMISVFWKTTRLYVRIRKNIILVTGNAEFHLLFSIGVQIFFLLYCMVGSPLDDVHVYITYFLANAIAIYYLVKFGNYKE